MKRHSILIVDDEVANLQKLRRTFVDEYDIVEAQSGPDALERLRRQNFSLIITDQRMPQMTGVELLRKSLEIHPHTVRVILTGYTEVDDIIGAINEGHVYQYVVKPWEPHALRQVVRGALQKFELLEENRRLAEDLRRANERLRNENLVLKKEVAGLAETRGFIFSSPQMKQILQLLDRVVATGTTVLIQGETGTGKELAARYLHEHSDRRDQIFVPINCGAIPKELIESELFGHTRGSYTGASSPRKGLFEIADHGTIFLDEIGEAPLELQVKLLRVLQEGEIHPIGSPTARRVDVRVIASTNRNLKLEVERGAFRPDLFYRLNVFSVQIPPLRERREDIKPLVEHFVRSAARRMNKLVSGIEPAMVAALEQYDWPGNVRELQNEVERMVILCDPQGVVHSGLVSDHVRDGHGAGRKGASPGEGLKEQLRRIERALIKDALERHRNNRSRAAQALGISRQTLLSKIKEFRMGHE